MPSKYIKSLMDTHGRVIVPELGAFILKGNTIYFNEFLRFNDGVLVDYIAQQEKINKNESTKKVSDFVNNVNKRLSTSKSIELEGLGELFVDSNDKIQLRPLGSKTTEKAPVKTEKDSGPREVFFEIEKTEPITPAKPASKSTKKTKAQTNTAKPVTETPKEQVKEVTPVETEKPTKPTQAAEPAQPVQTSQPVQPTKPTEVTPSTKTEQFTQVPRQPQPHRVPPPQKPAHTAETGKSNGKIWFGALAIIVISVIVYFAFFRNFLKDNNVNQNIIIGGKNLNDSLATAKDSVNETSTEISLNDQPHANLSQKSESKAVSKTEITKPKSSIEKKYYLVAGCFSVEANADKLVNQLSREGFPVEKFLTTKNNFYYVSYSSHVNRIEATQAMNRLKAAGKSNVWILSY